MRIFKNVNQIVLDYGPAGLLIYMASVLGIVLGGWCFAGGIFLGVAQFGQRWSYKDTEKAKIEHGIFLAKERVNARRYAPVSPMDRTMEYDTPNKIDGTNDRMNPKNPDDYHSIQNHSATKDETQF